jgi:predicted molibdopterin-dependent oxidoreductase YjgC
VQYENVLTTCVYCGCGCGIYLEVLDGKVVGALPAKGHPINEGRLCIKGWNVHDFVYHPERLTTPLIRDEKGGELREATWDEALNLVASRLSQIQSTDGPDAIGFLASAKCTNEENYLLQKLARGVIGTNNVDHCARL